jgi:hypothetical protein
MRKGRMAIYLEPDIKATYEATAALMGIPASRFVASLLTESEPSIKDMQAPLKAALTGKQQALTGMSGLIDDLKEQADEKQLDILEEIKKEGFKKSK